MVMKVIMTAKGKKKQKCSFRQMGNIDEWAQSRLSWSISSALVLCFAAPVPVDGFASFGSYTASGLMHTRQKRDYTGKKGRERHCPRLYCTKQEGVKTEAMV